jgi:hypothetical protein
VLRYAPPICALAFAKALTALAKNMANHALVSLSGFQNKHDFKLKPKLAGFDRVWQKKNPVRGGA